MPLRPGPSVSESGRTKKISGKLIFREARRPKAKPRTRLQQRRRSLKPKLKPKVWLNPRFPCLLLVMKQQVTQRVLAAAAAKVLGAQVAPQALTPVLVAPCVIVYATAFPQTEACVRSLSNGMSDKG